MANRYYNRGLNRILTQGLGATPDIRVYGIDLADYTPDTSTTGHEFLSSVPVVSRVAAFTLTGETLGVADVGNLDADDPTLPSVTGDQFEALVYVRYVTTDADSWLIGIIDTAPGLPFLPNGSPLKLNFDALGLISI